MGLATEKKGTTYAKGPQIHELMLAMTDGERQLEYVANPIKGWPLAFTRIQVAPEAFERTGRGLAVYGQAKVEGEELEPMTFTGTPNGGVIKLGAYDWLHGFEAPIYAASIGWILRLLSSSSPESSR
jgi:hypothetical protein